jgi:hypothetical protein
MGQDHLKSPKDVYWRGVEDECGRSMGHSPDMYNLIKDHIKEHINNCKMANDDLILAVDLATAVFNVFNDNWKLMECLGMRL